MSTMSALTDRQLELADSLVDLFVAQGFSAFTLDDIAARLGCSKRTLYVLADSKEQLATLAVRRFFRRATHRSKLRSPGCVLPAPG